MHIPFLSARQEWECAHPNCDQTDVTHGAGVQTRMHSCSGMKGLTTPFIPKGATAKLVAREREDYVGNERVTLNDDGRPIMSIETVRDDGSNDVTVFAPCAMGRVNG